MVLSSDRKKTCVYTPPPKKWRKLCKLLNSKSIYQYLSCTRSENFNQHPEINFSSYKAKVFQVLCNQKQQMNGEGNKKLKNPSFSSKFFSIKLNSSVKWKEKAKGKKAYYEFRVKTCSCQKTIMYQLFC